MVRVGADTEMETFLSGNLDQVSVDIIRPNLFHVPSWRSSDIEVFDFKYRLGVDPAKNVTAGYIYSLVGANTSSFQSLRAQLFILVGHQVDTEREFVNVRTLPAEVKDTWRMLVLK
jgi:hypothetical protein